MGTFKAMVNDWRGRTMKVLTRNIGSSTLAVNFDPHNVKRVLVCRPNSRLGNQLLVTPLLQELEVLLPDAKVDIFVRGFIAPILFKNYSNVDQIIRLPKKPFNELLAYAKVWLSLRRYPYDLVINVDGGSSSGRMATQFVRTKMRFFSDINPDLKAKYADYGHMAKFPVYNLRNYFRALGVAVDERPVPKLNIRLTDDEYARGAEVLNNIAPNGKKTICIYTFATGDKCYSKDWWKSMYNKLEQRYGAQFNIEEVLPIENISQIDFEAPSYYSKDLREIPAVVAASELFLGADCGIMHLVSAVDTPIVSLFSVTPIETYKPYNDGSVALDTTKITQEDVLAAIDEVLAKRGLLRL